MGYHKETADCVIARNANESIIGYIIILSFNEIPLPANAVATDHRHISYCDPITQTFNL